MKTLLFMRHAKSSWKEKELTDQERPINKRGRSDAPLMGHLLVDRELIPQRVISSSAVRARQTAEIVVEVVAESTGYRAPIDFLDRLYMAETPEYYEVLRTLPDDLERVMMIGHNPGLETVLQLLSNRIESLPTAVVAYIVLPIDHWSDLNFETTGELIDIWRPKDLREELEEEAEEKEKKAKAKEKEQEKEKEKEKAKARAKEKEKEKARAKEKDKGKKKK
jgi:phosphohistidine phosphatase